jgi:hypothetical protein
MHVYHFKLVGTIFNVIEFAYKDSNEYHAFIHILHYLRTG